MKANFGIIFFLFFHQLSIAQNTSPWDTKIDSLKNILENKLPDSVQAKTAKNLVDLLTNKAYNMTNSGHFAIAYGSYSEAFEFWDNPEMKLLFEDNEKQYWFILANMNFNYGHLMGSTGNVTERQFYYNKAYQISSKWGDVLNTVYALSGMAYVHLGNNELDSARLKIEKALTYPPELYDYNSYVTVLFIYGAIKLELGEIENAKETFLNGAAVARRRNSSFDHVLINYGLSKAYRHLGNPDSSYFYGLKALEVFMGAKDIRFFDIDFAMTNENLFEHFQYFEQPDSAYKYLQLAQIERNILTRKQITNMAAFQHVLLEREHRLSEIEKENIELESLVRIYLLLLVLGIFVLVGAILFRSYRQKQKSNIRLAKQKEEIEMALKQLKATQSQLIQSEKMASLGELTAGIAHEIQNPLNFVNNFSELNKELISELNDEIENGDMEGIKAISADINDNEEKINHHGHRASDIVKSMLDHSRSGDGKKELTDINKIADKYLRLAYHGIRAKDKSFNADFELDLDAALPKVNAEPQEIGRVLLNLINNAFQACSEQRERASADHSASTYQPLVTVTTKAFPLNEGEYKGVEIRVSDNGPGIPEDIRDKIFQPFFTTKPTGEGTGLGLSMSYDIITKGHGGELEVESGENKGTKFIIRLPI